MAVSELVARWSGPTWTAILTREPYGLHFSVGGQGRAPSDQEVEVAFGAYKFGLWIEEALVEVTSWWAPRGQVNPWVRHFVPAGTAAGLGVE